ncbi:MAG: alpha/beta fold hydrolase [Acetobacteraceae bacterium]|nr:alpha/beta fold hydrolase [Acetobacteraceae bacterium]
MIAMGAMVSTSPHFETLSRRAALLGAGALAACASPLPPVPVKGPADLDANAFIMADGARLPYRAWLPDGAPRAVVVALHGFNDSRDAWELPAPIFAAAGIAVYAYDQRGFGGAPSRGMWAGHPSMVADAAEITELLRRRHPGSELVVMGESMGGAVAMCLAVSDQAPAGARYVLLAPAVWGRARMNIFMRAGLWLAANIIPSVSPNRPPPGMRIVPTDNMEAWISHSRNPLTLRGARFDTLRGLVDLMDAALASAKGFPATALFLYGGNDMLIPQEATRTVWRALPKATTRRAYYPTGHHLLPRDLGRAVPIGDITGWILDANHPIPAEAAAEKWQTLQD